MLLGEFVRTRRENMDMSLAVLSREMGGSPGGSFLSKVESARADISPSVAVRLADALSLPRIVMLNAAGYATTDQVDEALGKLSDLVGTPAPTMVAVPVIDANDPTAPAVRMRQRLLKRKEDSFLIDLDGHYNEPYVGEALVSRERKPKEGQAVVAIVDGKAGAWNWHTSRPTGDYLSRGDGSKAAKGFRVLGVIIRVVSEMNLDNEAEVYPK